MYKSLIILDLEKWDVYKDILDFSRCYQLEFRWSKSIRVEDSGLYFFFIVSYFLIFNLVLGYNMISHITITDLSQLLKS